MAATWFLDSIRSRRLHLLTSAFVLVAALVAVSSPAEAQVGIWVRDDARIIGGTTTGYTSYLGPAGGNVERVVHTNAGDDPGLAVYDIAWDQPPLTVNPGATKKVGISLDVSSIDYEGTFGSRLSATGYVDNTYQSWTNGVFPHVDMSCSGGSCTTDPAGASAGSIDLSLGTGTTDGQIKTFQWSILNCGDACAVEWDYIWDSDGSGGGNTHCDGLRVTIGPDDRTADGNLIGTSLDDVIVGTDDLDFIDGKGGDDVICGLGGGDIIKGGGGDDRIFGGKGADTIRGEGGRDTIEGNKGNDKLLGGTKKDTIKGGSGDDRIEGNSGNDILKGGDGHDKIFGGTGGDRIEGGAHSDLLYGYGIHGNGSVPDGGDTMYGGSGNDFMWGGKGEDTMRGESGQDYMLGHGGDDRIYGGGNGDDLYGNAGDDKLWGGSGLNGLDGGGGHDGCINAGDFIRSCEYSL
ncbi:MAG: calcium-binding protein [bacterium]|nr:calcium-binding protein [bacterium]